MIAQKESKEWFIAKAQAYLDEGFACSQAVLLAYARHFDLDLRTAKLISSSFGGGMGHLRKTCGALTGGFMVLGLAYGNEDPDDKATKVSSYARVREVYHRVEANHGTVNCKELLQQQAIQSKAEERKHHRTICRQLVGEVAGLIYEQMEQSINQ